jgi:hypothetical protein
MQTGLTPMERPMMTYLIGSGAFTAKCRRLRSLLSARTGRRLAATLCALLIAFAAFAATAPGKRAPVGETQSVGSNLMLAPGWPGLAPVLY